MNPVIIICFIVVIISIVVTSIVMSLHKSRNLYVVDFANNIEYKPPPFYDYEYFQNYFNLPYLHFTTNVIQKVNWFFHDYPIIFICLKNNQERFQNIKKIIKKYKLKNCYILSALYYEDIFFDKDNTASIVHEKQFYKIEHITTETHKEIGCFLSHVKAMIFAKSLSEDYVVIVEDDVTFDFIQFSPYSVQELMENIDMTKGYLSLYNNKPNYQRDLKEVNVGGFREGFYGKIAYVMSKTLLEKFYNMISVESHMIHLPKTNSLFISDHYFPDLFPLHHVAHSIIIPNNLYISSSIHTEKDQSHIQIQYEYLLNLYHSTNAIKIKIPLNIILQSCNPFIPFYKSAYPTYKIHKVLSFSGGIEKLCKIGGHFIHNDNQKHLIHDTKDVMFNISSMCISSIKHHPYLKWVKNYSFYNIESNPYLTISPNEYDYTFSPEGAHEKFCFIIPAFNNEKWVAKNLDSIRSQTYPFYDIFYINDASTDQTLEIVQKYKKTHNMKNLRILSNQTRMYQAYSRYLAYRQVKDSTILVLLDGDDWLFDENVLLNIKKEYNLGYESTYGKAVFYEGGKVHKDKLLSQKQMATKTRLFNSYRQEPFFNVHLRTCRAKYLKFVPKSFLCTQDGNWLQHSTDMAEWFWIMEQTNGNVKFMDIITYVYNKDNSLLHGNSWFHNRDSKERKETIEYIRNIKKKK